MNALRRTHINHISLSSSNDNSFVSHTHSQYRCLHIIYALFTVESVWPLFLLAFLPLSFKGVAVAVAAAAAIPFACLFSLILLSHFRPLWAAAHVFDFYVEALSRATILSVFAPCAVHQPASPNHLFLLHRLVSTIQRAAVLLFRARFWLFLLFNFGDVCFASSIRNMAISCGDDGGRQSNLVHVFFPSIRCLWEWKRRGKCRALFIIGSSCTSKDVIYLSFMVYICLLLILTYSLSQIFLFFRFVPVPLECVLLLLLLSSVEAQYTIRAGKRCNGSIWCVVSMRWLPLFA